MKVSVSGTGDEAIYTIDIDCTLESEDIDERFKKVLEFDKTYESARLFYEEAKARVEGRDLTPFVNKHRHYYKNMV